MRELRYVSACLVLPSYTVRSAQPTDVPFLYACYKRAMHKYIEQAWRWDEEFQSEAFPQHLPWQRFQVIMVDGTPVGAACLLETPDHMVLEMMMIEPEFQHRGIGSDFVMNSLNTTAQGRLCHGASTRPVTQPSRPLASRLIDNYLGEILPH
jgi:Acetyltransferase (GNAT) family